MDREQEELQFLGFFGICKESIKIICTWSKIFTKLTLTLIIPLSIIFLANDGFSTFISSKIITNANTLDYIPPGTPTYNKISNLITSEWITFWIIKLVYFIFLLIFSLLSTSAIVYTIACIYTSKDVTFKNVLSVVPKVWKRLMVTFLWNFGIMFAYNIIWFFISLIIILIWLMFINPNSNELLGLNIVFPITFVIYLLGFAYINVIWQLACVISVLEDIYGVQAMMKSKDLIKGKMGISCLVFLVFTINLVGIEFLFEQIEVIDWRIGFVGKFGYGILCLVLLTLLFLFGLVVQTVIYFVCKSYHHENIDKSSLAHHLEGYLGEYVPLNSKNIQMEEFDV
ncbi:uncharacterized protein LOC130823232 [Amaranthus tricolor]|uniref:uncharacterized protein LOC130823232 n=1 Tax=Amaranthus tricolor TaxID=29722 RepID=UPI002590FA64|nr:uncharacterized protein LOC130823232 [Amaranthus tricolor]